MSARPPRKKPTPGIDDDVEDGRPVPKRALEKQQSDPDRQGNLFGVFSIIVGLMGLFFWAPFIMCSLGIFLGLISYFNGERRTLALSGIVLSIIGLVFYALAFFLSL
ncbi:MAG: hypothetical protein ACTSUE_19040 [Promethearchaeota archaeon]